MKSICFSVFFFLVAGTALSQTDRVQRGMKYRENFPHEDYVFSSTFIEISFTINQSKNSSKIKLDQDGGIEAIVKSTRNVVCLKDNAMYSDREYYSDISSINSIVHTDQYKKKKKISLVDFAYEDASVFHHDIRYKEFSFNTGNLGDETTYEVLETVKDLKYINKVFFNEYTSCEKVTVQIDVPEWLSINLREFNFRGSAIEHIITKMNGMVRHTYMLVNAKKIDNEQLSSSKSNTYPHLILVPAFYQLNGEIVKILSDKEDLYKWYKSLTKGLIYGDSSYTAKAKELIAASTSDQEKIKEIYYWIQDNIKYIAFEDGVAGFKPEEADKVYDNKYGDCKGMANLMKAMLKSVGFDARLAWVGTNDLPYDYSLPSLWVDNHMICALNFENKWYFLDGTEKFQDFGCDSYRIRGKQVMIESNSEVPLILTVSSNIQIRDGYMQENIFSIENGKMIGKVKVSFKGDLKNEFQYYKSYFSTSNIEKLYSHYFSVKNATVSYADVECENCDSRPDEVKISYLSEVTQKVSEFDNETYVFVDIDNKFADFPSDTNRVSDIDFRSYLDYSVNTELGVPKGYKIKVLPNSVSIVNEEFKISAKVELKNGILHYHKDISVFHGVISIRNYMEFLRAVSELKYFYQSPIILYKL